MNTARRWMSLPISMAVALALGACGKKEEAPKPAPPATTQATGGGGESAQPRREPEPAKEGEAKVKEPGAVPALPGPFATAGLLGVPKDAPFVVVGSPKKILDALGYQALLDKYGALLSGMGDKMVEVAGKDFFKPASWAEIGVDLEGSMGTFMPELGTEALVEFVHLGDAAKFQAFVSEIAKKAEAPLSSEKIGDATLLTVGDRDRNAWLIKGDTLFAVNMLSGNGAAAMAKEINARKEADSIAALPELKTAIEGLGADELGAFIQLRSILDKTVGALEPPAPPSGAYDKELEDAKKSGNQAEIARIEKLIADDKAFTERLVARHRAETDLVKELSSELSSVAIGLDITSDAVEAMIRVPLKEGGKLRGLLKNASATQPILKATKQEPILVLAGQVDPQAYLGLVEKLMAADGEDLGEARRELKERLGIDLDQDLIGALTGEMAFALTGDLAEVFKAKDPRSVLGGVFMFGVKSDAGLKSLIAKFATQEGVDKFLKWDEATSSAIVQIPEAQKIQIAFPGGSVLASTDTDTAARMAGSESFVSGLTNPKLKALLERKDLAALFTMRQSFMGTSFIGMGKRDGWLPEMPDDAPAAAKAKLEEIKKLDAEIEPLRRSVEEVRMKPVLDTFEKMGTMAEAVTMDGQGVSATFGLYPSGATVPEVVAALVDMAMKIQGESQPTEDEKKLRELEDRRWKLESEIYNLHRPTAEPAPTEEKTPSVEKPKAP